MAAGPSAGAGREPGSHPLPPADRWFRRHPLAVVAAAPLLPMLIGSGINIWYNLTQIDPLLTPAQRSIFMRTIAVYNGDSLSGADRGLDLAPGCRCATRTATRSTGGRPIPGGSSARSGS